MVRETLGEVNRQRVVGGAAAGLLSVDAIEWHRDTEARGITSGPRQRDLRGIAHDRVASADSGGEGGIRSRRPEEIKEGRRADKFSVERWVRAANQEAQRLRREHMHAAGIGAILSGGHVGTGSDHGHRIAESQTSGIRI